MMVGGGPRGLVGSKAFDLHRCRLLGVSVPEFAVVPTTCFRDCRERSTDGELMEEMGAVLSRFGGKVAVRSSSMDEDLAGGSRAGQYKTVLNVASVPELLDAVKAVWDSAGGRDMAVIVQRQLEPDIAGVLFTYDPAGGRDRTVIEYVKGLGDSLVSGKKEPKRLTFPNDGGGSTHGGPFGELLRISRRLREAFGYPLDIEWARCGGEFHILQARPITNLRPPGREAGRTFSRVQAEQFYSGPVSPLFFSMFRFLYEEYFIRETLDTLGVKVPVDGMMVRHRNHIYVDTALAEYALSRLPVRRAGGLLDDILPRDIRKGAEGAKPGEALPVLLRLLGYVMTRPELWIFRMDRHFRDEVAPALDRRLEELGTFAGMTEGQLRDAYSHLTETTARHFRAAKWGLGLYSMPLILAMHRFIERHGVDTRHLPALISGLETNRTLDASRELSQLASLIRKRRAARDVVAMDLGDYHSYRNELDRTPEGQLVVDSFECILARYGHRRVSRDIMSPSWRDDPMIPFAILRRMVIEGAGTDVDVKGASLKRREEVREHIERQLPWARRRQFRTLTKYLTRYVAFREFQRFYLDKILSKTRELFVEISRRMVEEGVLQRGDDIFFSDMDEVLAYLAGEKDLELVDRALFRRLSYESEGATPGRYMRLGIDFDAVEEEEAGTAEPCEHSGRVMRGEPVSPGRFSGRVRILDGLDGNVDIAKGDIIVTRCIDPGQTHLFLLAGALILEIGGMLSHGAILAREFDLPTVGRIKGATRVLKDGQHVLVDGNRGEVIIGGVY